MTRQLASEPPHPRTTHDQPLNKNNPERGQLERAPRISSRLSVEHLRCNRLADPTSVSLTPTYTNPVTGAQFPLRLHARGASLLAPDRRNNDYTVEPRSPTTTARAPTTVVLCVCGSGVTARPRPPRHLPSSRPALAARQLRPVLHRPVDPSAQRPAVGYRSDPRWQQWHTTASGAGAPAPAGPRDRVVTCPTSGHAGRGPTNLAVVRNGGPDHHLPNPAAPTPHRVDTVMVPPSRLVLAILPVDCYAPGGGGRRHTLCSYQVNVDNAAPTVTSSGRTPATVAGEAIRHLPQRLGHRQGAHPARRRHRQVANRPLPRTPPGRRLHVRSSARQPLMRCFLICSVRHRAAGNGQTPADRCRPPNGSEAAPRSHYRCWGRPYDPRSRAGTVRAAAPGTRSPPQPQAQYKKSRSGAR